MSQPTEYKVTFFYVNSKFEEFTIAPYEGIPEIKSNLNKGGWFEVSGRTMVNLNNVVKVTIED
ncbi:hypothetical protein V7138_15035 [Bacillus sp. JJ1533]|uniref:hypothetical protein n=1 Tax=Bacillus sp. JJ1533 TaxID=3122959 RepID=UPI002FFEC679